MKTLLQFLLLVTLGVTAPAATCTVFNVSNTLVPGQMELYDDAGTFDFQFALPAYGMVTFQIPDMPGNVTLLDGASGQSWVCNVDNSTGTNPTNDKYAFDLTFQVESGFVGGGNYNMTNRGKPDVGQSHMIAGMITVLGMLGIGLAKVWTL